MQADIAIGDQSRSKRWVITAVTTFFAAKLLVIGYQELTRSALWRDPAQRELIVVILAGGVAVGAAAVLLYLTRLVLVSLGVISVELVSDDEMPVSVEAISDAPAVEADEDTSVLRVLPEEAERTLIAQLLEAFQRDLFNLYVAPGVGVAGELELPEALSKIKQTGKLQVCLEFARDQARFQLNSRLRDLRKDWDLSPDSLARVEREVEASGLILLTAHTSIKSWQ